MAVSRRQHGGEECEDPPGPDGFCDFCRICKGFEICENRVPYGAQNCACHAEGKLNRVTIHDLNALRAQNGESSVEISLFGNLVEEDERLQVDSAFRSSNRDLGA